MKTFVIAEAGANHNRDYDKAISLIEAAKEANASAVKFQTYSSETLYAKNTPDFAGYKNINKLIKEIELPREWQKDLKKYCDDRNIEFMSTPFDEKAVEELVSIGVKRLKIAGFESTDFRFVEMVASTKLPVIISLGIGFDTSHHLKPLLDITRKYENELTLLHCNNAYPTPIEDCGLHALKELINKFPSTCGLSDHTESISIPSTAVALGATTIEKHFTLNRSLPGPDHEFALEPLELKQMIDLISKVEKSLYPPSGIYSQSEENFKNARRSVVSRITLSPGEIISKENITTKRPFLKDSIPASSFFEVLGSKVKNKIEADSCLSIGDVDFY